MHRGIWMAVSLLAAELVAPQEARGLAPAHLQILTTRLPVALAGQPYQAFVDAQGGDPATRTWSAAGLPSGLSIASQGDRGSISGVPTQLGGNFAPTISVTDADGNADEATIQLVVKVAGVLRIHGDLPQATAGMPYSAAIEVEGATDPLVLAVFAGDLPPGLSLSAAGQIEGRVNADAPLRTYPFIARATSNYMEGFTSFSIDVVAPPSPNRGGCSSSATPPGSAGVLVLLALRRRARQKS